MTKARIALRIDDIGASSKRYEIYSDRVWKLGSLRISGNLLFLKYINPFKKWGPYREMSVTDWTNVLKLLEKEGAKLTVGITAAWVESETVQIAFPQKFPDVASLLRHGLEQGILEIANHGLTHCVLKRNAFKPKWFKGNRLQHREFWEWLPASVHDEHVRKAQEILQNYFKTEVVTLIPPGNVFSQKTIIAARNYGIRFISANRIDEHVNGISMIDPKSVVAFHDRDLITHGINHLQMILKKYHDHQKVFVRELAEMVD